MSRTCRWRRAWAEREHGVWLGSSGRGEDRHGRRRRHATIAQGLGLKVELKRAVDFRVAEFVSSVSPGRGRGLRPGLAVGNTLCQASPVLPVSEIGERVRDALRAVLGSREHHDGTRHGEGAMYSCCRSLTVAMWSKSWSAVSTVASFAMAYPAMRISSEPAARTRPG